MGAKSVGRKVGAGFVVGIAPVVIFVAEVAVVVMAVEVGSVFSVVVVVVLSDRLVVVVSKGDAVVAPPSKGMNCLFVNLFNTYADTPRPRMVPKMRRIERSLGSMVFGFGFKGFGI